jgi:ketosteroid isomerase-like protein
MKYIFVLLAVALFIGSCNAPVAIDLAADKASMKKADIDFSGLSKQKGMKAAFLEYMDSAGILLRPDHYPIIGKDARQFLQNANDSSFTLTWEPSAAEVSTAGDLGFTYGIYTLALKDTAIKGTYVSIWKKQADGNWKFVLDTGNPGLEPEK